MKRQIHSAVAISAGAIALCAASPAHAQLITGETGTASSAIGAPFDRVPAHAVDDSGLSAGDNTAVTPDQTHSNALEGVHWLSSGDCCGGVDPNPFYAVDLGAVYDVTAVRVFNYNEVNLPTRGVQAARLFTSETAMPTTNSDPTTGTPVVIPIASGLPEYRGDLLLGSASAPFGTATIRARYFLLDIDSNYGGDNNFFGLSELQFDGAVVPEPGSLSLLGLGGLLALRRRRR